MFFKTCAALALATGFAAASPISHSRAVALPVRRDLTARQLENNNAAASFNFISGFESLNDQQQIVQVSEQSLQIIDNGIQQQVVQQATEVLVVQNQQNGFNNQLNNLFRKSNFQNQFPDQSTVLMVVNEIQVSVDDGRGNRVDQSVFAQSVVVANRGRGATQTIMVVAETIVASSVLNNNNRNNNNNNRNGSNNNARPTVTAGFQLFNQKPTWSSIAADPAATLGAIWQAELEDLNKIDNNNGDNELNRQIADIEKKALEDIKRVEEEAARKADEEQKKVDEEAKKAEEEAKKAEEQKVQDEQRAQEDEARKADEEAKKAEEQKAQDEQKAAEEHVTVQ